MRRINNYKRSPLGFTLIELLFVMGIMALLFSVGYANYRDYSRQKDLEKAITELKSDIRLVQQMALAGDKSSHLDCSCATCKLNGNFVRRLDSKRYQLGSSCVNAIGELWGREIKTVDYNTLARPVSITLNGFSPTCAGINLLECLLFKTLGQGTNIDILAGEPTNFRLTHDITGESIEVSISAGGEIK